MEDGAAASFRCRTRWQTPSPNKSGSPGPWLLWPPCSWMRKLPGLGSRVPPHPVHTNYGGRRGATTRHVLATDPASCGAKRIPWASTTPLDPCQRMYSTASWASSSLAPPSIIAILSGLVPHVGMKFKNSDEAWAFWLTCGRQKGFEVRKKYTNKRSADGKLIGLQRCDNDGVAQPTTTMEMGVQVGDVGLLRAYAEVFIMGDDSRRPTNRTPLDRHGGGRSCSTRCSGCPVSWTPMGAPAARVSRPPPTKGALATCCFVSRPPWTARAPSARVALFPGRR